MMRVLALLFFALTIGAAAQYYSSNAPGVVFSLTPYYGVAAIHLEDGTSVPVAQIYGSPDYQAFMARKIRQTFSNAGTNVLCQLFPALNHLSYPLNSTIDICTNSDVIHTKALLAGLKAATESYLGTSICYATLSLDTSAYKTAVAEQALGALGLYQAPRNLKSSIAFIHASGLRAYNEPEPEIGEETEVFKQPDNPWLLLAIDYSAHWFNVGLYIVEDGVLEQVGGFVGGPRINNENQPGALKNALRHLFDHPPIEDELPRQLRSLVLYGDNAHSPALLDVLTEVLRHGGTVPERTRALLRDASISSSVFDGPAHAASGVYYYMRLNDHRIPRPTAFGCNWRSKYYSRNKAEL